jgi:hypothetical protein
MDIMGMEEQATWASSANDLDNKETCVADTNNEYDLASVVDANLHNGKIGINNSQDKYGLTDAHDVDLKAPKVERTIEQRRVVVLQKVRAWLQIPLEGTFYKDDITWEKKINCKGCGKKEVLNTFIAWSMLKDIIKGSLIAETSHAPFYRRRKRWFGWNHKLELRPLATHNTHSENA